MHPYIKHYLNLAALDKWDDPGIKRAIAVAFGYIKVNGLKDELDEIVQKGQNEITEDIEKIGRAMIGQSLTDDEGICVLCDMPIPRLDINTMQDARTGKYAHKFCAKLHAQGRM